MRIALLATLAIVPAIVPPWPSPPEIPQERPRLAIDEERLIFHAVLEGLYADGVANDVVDAALEREETTGWPRYFIYACPICMPALNAFATYRARPGFLGSKTGRDTFGPGLPEHVREALLSDDVPVRLDALRERVEVWMGRRIASMRLTEAERERLTEGLVSMRKEGLYFLQQYMREPRTAIYAHMESCPWCDGANDAMDF